MQVQLAGSFDCVSQPIQRCQNGELEKVELTLWTPANFTRIFTRNLTNPFTIPETVHEVGGSPLTTYVKPAFHQGGESTFHGAGEETPSSSEFNHFGGTPFTLSPDPPSPYPISVEMISKLDIFDPSISPTPRLWRQHWTDLHESQSRLVSKPDFWWGLQPKPWNTWACQTVIRELDSWIDEFNFFFLNADASHSLGVF